MRKLINLFTVFLPLIFTLNAANAQVQQAWVARYNGPENKGDRPEAVAADASGNVYVAGTRDQNANTHIHTVKYSPSGALLWERDIAGVEFGTDAKDMSIDVNGNVYVTGLHFESGEGDCLWDAITVKYNSSGTQQWFRVFGIGNYSAGQFVATDAAGNVYVAGIANSNGQCTGHEGPLGEYLVLKYDPSGNLQWSRTYNGTAPGTGLNNTHDLAVDGAGNVFVTGESQLNGQTDYATIKYSTTGTVQWIQRYDGPGNTTDFATGLALDASGNVYVTGGSTGTSSHFDIGTVKYNSAGAQQWVQRFNGSENLDDVAADIAVDGFGNSYITGRTGITNFSSFISVTLKYNSAGAQQWVQTYENNNLQNGTTAIVLDGSINVYVTGMRWQPIEGTDVYRIGYLTIKYDSDGAQRWTKTFDGPANDNEAVDIAVSGDNVYVTGESDGGSTTHVDWATIKYTQCELHCPSDITVNNDANQCGAVVSYSNATTTGNCGSTITYSKNSGTIFPVGTTTVTVTSTETGATCSFNVTVVDNTPPLISCPSDKTINVDPGVCYASATTVNAGTATATDNCTYDVVGARSDGLALTANYPVGITTITWTATDASNNTTTCSQTITVVDNVPPTITGESASTYVLSPPNHTMRDVTVSYTATDNCAVTSVITVTSNEPINGVGDGDTDPDWVITDNHHVKLRAERSANGTGRIYTITITATDPSGNIAAKTIEVRVPHDIKNPHSGQAFKVGSTVTFEGEFWDKAGNSHSAKWLIDDNLSTKGIVTEPIGNKNGKVTGSYKFTSPGVYKLQMNVTDQNGIANYANTNGDLEAIIVIFDPNGGNTYGGGYFNSPAGALRSDPSVTGKASYGFAMNYFKNSTNPKGETQFEFKVGSFEFNALNFEYLVISNSMAQFKGTGKITGGQSGVGFTMTVTDGHLDGSGVDKIRMKIYNKNNGSIIYDNQFGASDAALPTQAVGANSIVVISGTNSSLTSANTNQKGEMETKAPEVSNDLDVIAFPNPSTNNFKISVNAKANERITLQVVDMYGRIIETRNVSANSITRFGDHYRPGTYFVRIIKGKENKIMKLVRLPD